MKCWLTDLDRVLRGEANCFGAPEEGKLTLPLGGLLGGSLLLTVLYGACMGFFAGFREGGPVYMQWLACMVKVPALFLLSLAVTFPSLYVFNALVRSRLNVAGVFQLLIISLSVNTAVLASLGPIVAFFSVSTTSYPFILLLNVLVFAVSGILGYAFLLQTLNRLNVADCVNARPDLPMEKCSSPASESLLQEAKESAAPLEAELVMEKGALPLGVRKRVLERRVKNIFICWMMVSGLVTAQMAWVLRPFLGKPFEDFRWFYPRESNFLHGFLNALSDLLS